MLLHPICNSSFHEYEVFFFLDWFRQKITDITEEYNNRLEDNNNSEEEEEAEEEMNKNTENKRKATADMLAAITEDFDNTWSFFKLSR